MPTANTPRRRRAEDNKIGLAARKRAALRALNRGEITRPSECQYCGKICATVLHHKPYATRWDRGMSWLCRACHREASTREKWAPGA